MNQRRLGDYELQERLGRGAVGETWQAFDTLQRQYVAIKMIEVQKGEFLAWLEREGRALQGLSHPNIVHVRDIALAPNGNEAYVVMDYIEGSSLLDYLDVTSHTGNIPSANEIARLLTPVAAALDYAHQQRVLHGALKPSVVLFDRQRPASPLPGEPMVTNFGLPRKRDLRLLSLDDAHYVAPEVAQGGANTVRGDLYALGVILYELCTGALPFEGETASDVLMQHMHGTPTSPALINPQIRPALTGVVLRALARDPAARFSSATALVTAALKALNRAVPEGTSLPLSAPGIGNSGSLPPVSGASVDEMNKTTYFSPRASQPLPALPGAPELASGQAAFRAPMSIVPSATPVWSSQVSGALPVVPPTPILSPQTVTSGPDSGQASSLFNAPTLSATSPPVPVRGRRRRRTLFAVLAAVLVLVLLGSSVLVYLSLTHISSTAQSSTVGHAFFISSGLISAGNNQGITDELHISLQNIKGPDAGKQYYGWLTSTSVIDTPALSLGALSVDHGQIALTFKSPEHSNLLANYNRFLITEEDAGQQPANPSPDKNTWSYYSTFSTVANPADPKHYSLFDHLRHLLSQDPKLAAVGLTGGLDVWLYRNTSKILEAAGSARDNQKLCVKNPSTACTDFVLRQVARILDYLDGSAYIHIENIPPAIQGPQLLIDPTIARVAMLEFDTLQQQPPGYLNHIGTHLQEVSQLPGATASQRTLAIQINQYINNVQGWLDTVHARAGDLIHMSSEQLVQPATSSILNDLFNQANAAFIGQVDPNTNSVKGGVVQIHYDIQALATFDVTPCTAAGGQSSCG